VNLSCFAVLIGLLLAADVSAQGASKRPVLVPVCIANDPHVRRVAEALSFTSLIFERVGVRIVWHQGFVGCDAGSIRIQLRENTPADERPGAMAYAMPYAGFQVFTSGQGSTGSQGSFHIEVFYDRIEKMGERLAPRLFAHVLTHEIIHVLQGQTQHAAEGIMKARYTQNDYSAMLQRQLTLTRADVELLQQGIAARAKRLRDERLLLAGQKGIVTEESERSTGASVD
jgi:hypothetical protein